MEQYEHEIETVDQLQHLNTFGMKPPYRFGTHEDDPLAKEYNKLNPQVLFISSSLMAGQRRGHQFLSSRHAAVVWKTNATIYDLRDVVNIDSWRKTASFAYETMRSAPDTSFDESGTSGGEPRYQWYTQIEVACQNFGNALAHWRKCNEELDWGFKNNLVQTNLPDQIARLNRMNRQICGIEDLIHVADGMDVFFMYRRSWTVSKMRRSAPPAVSILGLIQYLQKVSQTNDWLFEDRAPFLAYMVDLLLRRHQLRGLRGTTRLRYKRYRCAPVRTQELMVQLQEYHRPGQSTVPYAYHAVAAGAPIDLVQLATIYQTRPGQIRYYDFEKEIRRGARLHSTNEAYVNLFPFEDAADLTRRLGTLKYLMSAFEGREAGSDPRGHLGVTWGVYLCAGKPPLADIILSHPPELTRCDSVIGLAIPAMSGHIQNRGTASGDLYSRISGINRVLLS